MKNAVELTHRMLSHKEHILHRPERHIGSVRPTTEYTWAVVDGNIKWGEYTYRPALLKMFDEIIINSVDFSKTEDGKHLDSIQVSLCPLTGSITVTDNGGIPVVKHKEYGGWLPDMLFGELFSSSNYNENDEELANKEAAGQNGEGASLVNVFSKTFTVITSDGKNRFKRTWSDNSNVKEPEEISPTSLKGTSISYIPDESRLPKGNPRHDYLMLVRRVYEIAACNPHIKVSVNDKLIEGGFNTLCNLLGCGVSEESGTWKVGLFPNYDNVHASYVNSVNTKIGGPHIDYVLNKIIEYVRPKLKRAYKKDYKPSIIRSVMGLVLVCTVDLPRFKGQTKEELTTPVKDFGTKWEPTKKFLDDAARCIIEWFKVMHRDLATAEEEKKLDEAQKEAETVKYYHIDKYSRATSKDRSMCTLFLTEGDSAAKPLSAAADRKIHGIFPLRGKILNLMNASPAMFAKNTEVKNIISIMGGLLLKGGIIEEKLNYSSIVLAMDADCDGIHIRGLVALAFMVLWPDFIKQGRLKYLETPVVMAYQGKKLFEFFSEAEFEEAQKTQKFSRVKYLKGLGSNTSENFRRFITDEKYIKTFELTDASEAMMRCAFDEKKAEDRKELFKEVQYQCV